MIKNQKIDLDIGAMDVSKAKIEELPILKKSKTMPSVFLYTKSGVVGPLKSPTDAPDLNHVIDFLN